MGFIHFRLLDKKTDEDSFFQNADGTRDETKKLDFTNSRGILNPFFIINDQGERVYYRYIAGCKIFDIAEQDKQKYVFNMQSGALQFFKGADISLDETKGKILIDFLKIHPENTKSPNHNPDIHEGLFYTFDPKEVIKEEITLVKIQDEALEVLRILRKEENKDKMRAIAKIFATTAALTDDEEIYLELRKMAIDDPSVFKTSIANRENEVLSDILVAQKYHVIGRDAKGYFYESDKTPIFETTVKAKDAAEKVFVTYLMSNEGEVHYKQILVKIKQAEIQQESPSE